MSQTELCNSRGKCSFCWPVEDTILAWWHQSSEAAYIFPIFVGESGQFRNGVSLSEWRLLTGWGKDWSDGQVFMFSPSIDQWSVNQLNSGADINISSKKDCMEKILAAPCRGLILNQAKYQNLTSPQNHRSSEQVDLRNSLYHLLLYRWTK